MHAIILAAGYATRLYPLTQNQPKSLLTVAEKPIVEHIIAKISEIKSIGKIYIVTNNKFEKHFNEWLDGYDCTIPIEIINDGTTSNDDRLGALGDVHFAINKKNINDDVIVIAGDNLFEISLSEVSSYFNKKKSNVIVLYDVKDFELAKQYGIVEAENGIVSHFEEKPVSPKSTLASTGIYLFPKKTIELIKKYIAQGNNPDKAGNFIEWLHKREKVFAFTTDKKWYDIGDFEQLEKADKYYKAK